MKLIKGDLWKFHDAGEWICVTTNGFVKANGCAVMGRGTALQCKRRYPEAERMLGDSLRHVGNTFAPFLMERKIAAFPVKHVWWEKADLELIKKNASVATTYLTVARIERIYLPRPGCGNGQLPWKEVERVIRPILDDRFIVVEYDPETV